MEVPAEEPPITPVSPELSPPPLGQDLAVSLLADVEMSCDLIELSDQSHQSSRSSRSDPCDPSDPSQLLDLLGSAPEPATLDAPMLEAAESLLAEPLAPEPLAPEAAPLVLESTTGPLDPLETLDPVETLDPLDSLDAEWEELMAEPPVPLMAAAPPLP